MKAADLIDKLINLGWQVKQDIDPCVIGAAGYRILEKEGRSMALVTYPADYTYNERFIRNVERELKIGLR